MIDSHSFSNIPTDSTVHVPDQYYLDYFKKSYGSFVTSIVNENNESYDYTVSNNLVFSDDEKILVSTLDSASGTIVIPETVEKIADQAFSGNSDITQIILTGGNIELGHQIFKDSGVEDVMILTQDMPSVYKDTFSDSDNLKGISIARNYYHLYESKWSDLLEPTEFALLNETDSSLNVKDGFEYLEMYYRDRAHATILLNAPSDLVYFDESYTGEYPEEAPFTISELEEIYPCASAKSKVDEKFKEKAHQATLKLQSGYAPYTAIWKHIMKVSVEDLKKNYGNLNVDFDLWKGESDAQPYIPGLIQDLIDKKLAYESQGALVVDIAKEDDTKELPPCIVRKSDGAALYATSDLATIIQREQDYKPNHYIYVADKRQELHFTQVFRVSKKANIVDENTKMEFLGFGTMNGKDGKPFKTRDGGVMRLENLIAQINKAVYDKIMENRTVSEEEANNTAKIVGLAALKYGDLSNQASKDYIFDIDRFASFEGNTGPYILYTIVRIKSILEKYKAESGNADVNLPVINTDNGSQMQLMLEVAKFNEIIENAAEELAPHKICSYVYDLSNAFNRFYHETKILAEEDQTKKAGYIALINLTINVLEQCIDLLGFSAPDRM